MLCKPNDYMLFLDYQRSKLMFQVENMNASFESVPLSTETHKGRFTLTLNNVAKHSGCFCNLMKCMIMSLQC